MALISVLWGTALLALIATSLLSTGNTSYQLARNEVNSARIDAITEAAVARATLTLLDARPESRWRVDGVAQDFAFDGQPLKVSIQDELGRIDLNNAEGALLSSLFKSTSLDAESASKLVDKILDWRDASAAKRINGAKDQDYRIAGYSYRPRNGPFQSVDELKLVMGMTPALFRRVQPAITVYSGRPLIDPRVAPVEALLALPSMDAAKAASLIAGRGEQAPSGSQLVPQLAGRAFSISVRFEGKDTPVVHEVVIRLADDPLHPFWILHWGRNGQLKLN
jgi:general secretion pathway protein K